MSEKFLTNKTAIVTGGTRGIGRAIAASLLDAGAHVAICGTRQKSVDDALAALAPKGEIFGMVADVSQLNDVRRFVGATKDRFGTINILVNNAGVGVFRSVVDIAPEEWQRVIGLNLTAAYYCCHEILPIFRQNGSERIAGKGVMRDQQQGGDIVNISSLAGKNPFAGGAAYNASKFGLNGFSEATMLDHRNDGIRVMTVMPGSVDTEFGGSKGGERSTWKIAPEDIADIVLSVLRMPRRITISQVEVRPSRPPQKS